MSTPKVIDLSKGHRGDHPDIKTDGTSYLYKWAGRWSCGQFVRVWYGLTAHDGHCNPQFDASGYNKSKWEEMYEICDGPPVLPDTRNPRKVRIQ